MNITNPVWSKWYWNIFYIFIFSLKKQEDRMKSYQKYSENVWKLVQQTTILKGPFYDTKFSEGRFFMLADFLCTNNVPHHFLWRYQSFFFGDNFQVFFSFYFRTMFRSFFHLYFCFIFHLYLVSGTEPSLLLCTRRCLRRQLKSSSLSFGLPAYW